MSAQSFGKYQLLKKIATGGMAEVWLARQIGIEGFQRSIVVKRILPHLADDKEFVQMFLNEAKIAARFNHPNIAQIYDLGEVNGTYFIAMEYIHGEDLGRLMRKAWSTGQWIARPLAIRIVAECCAGLSYAHSKNDEQGRPLKVVHRDISPQNILVSFDGSVKLVDFGIAKAADQASLTKSGAIKGKFAYMSPEQAAGKALDHRSDIFAIGLVLYELLTGVRPLKKDNEIATLQAALECAIEPPSAVSDVPGELDDVVMKALSKAADDRYRDARLFQMALEEFLVAQRWVASSVQISELMGTLFAERIAEEARPSEEASSSSSAPAMPPPEPVEPEMIEVSRTDAPKKQAKASSTAEMNWEAPPGTSEISERSSRSSGRGLAKASYRSEPAAPKTQPPPDVPAWDAPPSTEIPGRRRSGETRASETGAVRRPTSNANETAIARTPSRPEMPRSRVPTDTRVPVRSKTVTRQAPPDDDDRRDDDERLRADQERDDRDDRDERDDRDDDRTSAAPPARSKSSSSAAIPRTNSKGSMRRNSGANLARAELRDEEPEPRPPPEPPAPSRKKVPTGVEKARRVSKTDAAKAVAEDAALDKYIDIEGARERSRKLWKVLVWGIPAGGVLLMLVVFWGSIVNALSHTASTGQEIYVTVESSIPVKVSVRHHKDEHARDPVTEMGSTPLTRAAGAHLRDTIILENKEQGAYYEEEIPFGEPQETKKINKEFKTGKIKLVKLGPKGLENLAIYLNDRQQCIYTPGVKCELYEGKHLLELRGDALKAPAPFEVEVKAGATTEVNRDLGRFLVGSPP